MQIDQINSNPINNQIQEEQQLPSSVAGPAAQAAIQNNIREILLPGLEAAYTLKGPYVGELQERWEFPSDHLPVGAAVDGMEIASWNVLNTLYIDWVYKNTQGLSRSQITQQNFRVGETALTLREVTVAKDLVSMINHRTNPKSIIALQECGEVFLSHLTSVLPSNWKIVYSATDAKDQNVILYNSDVVTYLPEESSFPTDAFPCNPGRSLMDVTFKNNLTGKKYQVINSHVPGDPALPGRYEFVNYVVTHSKKDTVNIALGDINFDQYEMQEAFDRVNKQHSFINHVHYDTNVGLDLHSKQIDHIFVQNADSALSRNPNEVLLGLQKTVDLFVEQETLLQNR